jgi:spermidine/putrescine transport system permease protein
VSRRRHLDPRARLLLLALPGALVVLVVLILPLLTMVIFSFWRAGDEQMTAGWTLDNYRTLLAEGDHVVLLGHSLGVASVVALVCLLYAWPCAYLIARHGGRHRLLLVLLIAAPVLTGSLPRIMAMTQVLGPAGLVNLGLAQLGLAPIDALMYSRAASAIGLIHLWIPLMLIAVYLSLRNFDFRLLEVAETCGATPWRAFWAVTWPLNWTGTAIGIVLVVVPTLGATITPLFLGGPDGALYGNVLADQLGAAGSWALGAAMGVALLAVSLIVVLIVWLTVDLSRSGLAGRAE